MLWDGSITLQRGEMSAQTDSGWPLLLTPLCPASYSIPLDFCKRGNVTQGE
jgi:hypothetical protein